MKKLLTLILFVIALGKPAAAQQVISLTVTNSPTPIVTTLPAAYVLIRENSATPSAVFTITITGNSTSQTFAAGQTFVFQPGTPYLPGVQIGTISASTSGPFTFTAMQTLTPPTLSTSGTGSFPSVSTGSNPPTCTPATGGVICGTEGTAPSVGPAVGVDVIYWDSTNHCAHAVFNNVDLGCLIATKSTLALQLTQGNAGSPAICGGSAACGNQSGFYFSGNAIGISAFGVGDFLYNNNTSPEMTGTSAALIDWSATTSVTGGPDTGLSRCGAGIVCAGTGSQGSTAGQFDATSYAITGVLVSALPAASSNAGQIRYVTDSTTVSAEGQTCVGSSTNKAMAWSNGTVWKCF